MTLIAGELRDDYKYIYEGTIFGKKEMFAL